MKIMYFSLLQFMGGKIDTKPLFEFFILILFFKNFKFYNKYIRVYIPGKINLHKTYSFNLNYLEISSWRWLKPRRDSWI
jgi:hypothetical protein